MINPKHPLKHYNIQQELFLQHLSEINKEYHTLKLSYSNAVYLYYDLQLNVSVYNYKEWLNGIEDKKLRIDMELKGFENCRKNCLFVHFMKDKRYITENDYVQQKMGNKEYIRYKELCI